MTYFLLAVVSLDVSISAINCPVILVS